MKREAAFYGTFRSFLQNRFKRSGAFEIKQTTKDSIPFSAVQPHQIAALIAAKRGTLVYKPPDDTRGFKPCDFLVLHSVRAYVVIKYPEGFVLIDVDDWSEEERKSQSKSLTWERARQICSFKD